MVQQCKQKLGSPRKLQFHISSSTTGHQQPQRLNLSLHCHWQSLDSSAADSQQRWFSLLVNSLHIRELLLPLMLCFFSNPNYTAFSSRIDIYKILNLINLSNPILVQWYKNVFSGLNYSCKWYSSQS